jgi:fermentation-respiration switch protein FrsA (DUF1100 family)
MDKGTVFFPDPHMMGTPTDWGLPYQEVWFETSDGVRLNGWFIPSPDDDPQAPCLLWFHGNGGNISHRLENLSMLHSKVGCSVFIFDYREYGLSGGSISKAGTFLDAEAAYETVLSKPDIDPGRLVLFGRSLGTALAVNLAVRRACAGAILEAAFTSTADMQALYGAFLPPSPPGAVVYDSIGQVEQVQVPLLFIHGALDFVIPPSMGQTLYDKATSPKRFYLVEGADHNDTYWVGGEAYFQAIAGFLQECTADGTEP